MTKILVVEDDPEVRSSLVDLLDAVGYAVVAAEDGLKALEFVKHELPDLIISDITMPNMDGYQVLRELKKRPAIAAIPFIFLSAKAEYGDVRKAMMEGADDYITKPFKARELYEVIKNRLKKKNGRKI